MLSLDPEKSLARDAGLVIEESPTTASESLLQLLSELVELEVIEELELVLDESIIGERSGDFFDEESDELEELEVEGVELLEVEELEELGELEDLEELEGDDGDDGDDEEVDDGDDEEVDELEDDLGHSKDGSVSPHSFDEEIE